MLFIHETHLVYKLGTFINCKEVKHIMIMIIAMIYIFLSYVIFDQQLKSTFRKSSASLPEKIQNPLPPKNSKSVGHPFFSTSKIFQPLPAERGRRILWNSLFLTTDHYLHFLGKALTNRVRMYLAYLKLQIAIFDHLLMSTFTSTCF